MQPPQEHGGAEEGTAEGTTTDGISEAQEQCVTSSQGTSYSNVISNVIGWQ